MRLLSNALGTLGLGVMIVGCAAAPPEEPSAEQSDALVRCNADTRSIHALGYVMPPCRREVPPPPPPPPPRPTADSCVYTSFERVGERIKGWVIDLCDGTGVANTFAYVTFLASPAAQANPGGYAYLGACEYVENYYVACSGTEQVTVTVNGQSYTGPFGFDIDPLAGGAFASFDIDSYLKGSTLGLVEPLPVPFDHTFVRP